MNDSPPPRRRSTLASAFRAAFQGLRDAVRTQRNMAIHLAAAAVVIVLGLVQKLANWEWCAVALCIGLVITAELMNTAIEAVVDLVSPEYHERARMAKDTAAAAVLVAAATSVVVGWFALF